MSIENDVVEIFRQATEALKQQREDRRKFEANWDVTCKTSVLPALTGAASGLKQIGIDASARRNSDGTGAELLVGSKEPYDTLSFALRPDRAAIACKSSEATVRHDYSPQDVWKLSKREQVEAKIAEFIRAIAPRYVS